MMHKTFRQFLQESQQQKDPLLEFFLRLYNETHAGKNRTLKESEDVIAFCRDQKSKFLVMTKQLKELKTIANGTQSDPGPFFAIAKKTIAIALDFKIEQCDPSCDNDEFLAIAKKFFTDSIDLGRVFSKLSTEYVRVHGNDSNKDTKLIKQLNTIFTSYNKYMESFRNVVDVNNAKDGCVKFSLGHSLIAELSKFFDRKPIVPLIPV